MSELVRRYGRPLTAAMAFAVGVWVLMMVALPYFVMVEFSFRPNLPVPEMGGPKDHYTLVNYRSLFSGIDLANGVLPDDFRVFLRTIWGSAFVTFVCFVVCYPMAYYLAKVAPPQRTALVMLLLVIPFWINEILRTFAWFILLGYQGPLNAVLLGLGIIGEPVRWLSGSGGVILGMVYAFLLFMMFPLYNALETLDRNQVEAAEDLGASTWRIHWRVVLPHAKPGVAVGCIMVFVLAASSYIVPYLLGSPGTRWFTQTIYEWFFEAQDWPRGAAYSFLLLGLCVVFIMAMMRIFRFGLTDIAR